MSDQLTATPLVTVYITTCNRLQLLKRAVESVLLQTYKNIEIIIVDDKSSDGTVPYLVSMASDRPNIKVFFNEKNLGACFGRNLAIQHASGTFITGLDDDDYFLQDRIDDFIQSWPEDGDIACLHTDLTYLTSNKTQHILKKPRLISQKDMQYGCQTGSQVFTRTELLRGIGGFDNTLPMWQDLDCWYRLLAHGKSMRVNNASYVVDKTHDYERISGQRHERLMLSYDTFCRKHQLTVRQKNRLRSQTIAYNPSSAEYLKCIIIGLLLLDLRLAWQCFRYMRNTLRSH